MSWSTYQRHKHAEVATPTRWDDLSDALVDLAQQFPSFGYRRLWACARNAGFKCGRKTVLRLCRELGIQVRSTRKRKKIKLDPPTPRTQPATSPMDVLAIDFMHDVTSTGKSIRICNVICEHTRRYLDFYAATSIKADDVVELLDHIINQEGVVPSAIRTDNGPELRSRVLKEWAAERGVEILYCPPGKPWHNGLIESFHNRVRLECLNTYAFDNLEECIYTLENWQHQYNNQHPHSALNWMTPNQFQATCGQQGKHKLVS